MTVTKILIAALVATGTASASPFVPSQNLALTIPRGGGVLGTSITKENIAAGFLVVAGVNGMVGWPAPEVMAKVFYNQDISEGTLEHFWYENYASTVVGLVIMVYLAVFKDYSAIKTITWGGLPCLITTWKHLLKGTFRKFGYPEGFGTGQLVFMVACLYFMCSGKWNPEDAAKLFSLPSLVFGGLGVLSSDIGAKAYGLTEPTGQSAAVFYWYSALLLWWGVFAMALIRGESPMKALTYTVVVWALNNIDANFVRRVMDNVQTSKNVELFFTVISVAMAAGLVSEEMVNAIPKNDAS